ncbi:MAG: GDSL-type esterase/lipase family protein [Pirellulaceae bacterium]|nr:GDSL-type esterase/lipase family protein [Pirellulaceae bacterium]
MSLAILCLVAIPAIAAEPFQFQPNDRVVLLGSGLAERLQFDGYFEGMLTVACADKNLTFRNLGWSGDTVWGDSRGVFGSRAEGFKRLVKDVTEAQPTVLAICYGENEAYAGEAGLADFRAGLLALLDALKPTGARVLLIAPPPHENLGPPLPSPTEYNSAQAKYADAIAALAQERGAGFIAPVAKQGTYLSSLTTNGFQFTKLGAWLWAWDAGEQLGLVGPDLGPLIELDAAKAAVLAARRTAVADVAWDGTTLRFTATEPLLLMPPQPPAASLIDVAPPPKSLPGSHRVLRIRNLPAGNYELRIDGEKQDLADQEVWSRGLALRDAASVAGTAKLRELAAGKNELYFHRYRPQNETYLFLFRKHEQGNNAVEIPQFDPLVAAKEREIATLCRPVARKYELTRQK